MFYSLIKKQNKTKMRYTVFSRQALIRICTSRKERERLIEVGGLFLSFPFNELNCNSFMEKQKLLLQHYPRTDVQVNVC